jgi:RNA polymerase sigma-70 factor, ECF subfamily
VIFREQAAMRRLDDAAMTLDTPPKASDLIAHRHYLVRFAQRHLADPLLAEDAVHDVFEAVLSGRARFGGRSALRSWLTGVLKHKIVDQIRRSPFTESLDLAGDDDDEPRFDPESEAPAPDHLAEVREHLAQTLDRIAGLPANLRDAVQLRLIEDRTTAEVCAALAISEENLFVRLHRARKALAH